jgi:hypothetical protein
MTNMLPLPKKKRHVSRDRIVGVSDVTLQIAIDPVSRAKPKSSQKTVKQTPGGSSMSAKQMGITELAGYYINRLDRYVPRRSRIFLGSMNDWRTGNGKSQQ